MIKHKFELNINNKTVFQNEDHTYSAFREIEKELSKILWSHWRQSLGAAQTVGQRGSLDLGTLSWECTMNGRAPARPKDVIAAEKAARAVKSQTRMADRERWKKEAAERIVNMRKRIKNQVDHAFALGSHGTEPAAKYITCQHCDAPAAVLSLSSAPARGSSVLDEDTIVGALCHQHRQSTPYSYYNRYRCGSVTTLEVSRLEFFYDGIRQIAIKP